MLGRPNFLKASLMLLLASGLPLTGCGDGSGPTPTPNLNYNAPKYHDPAWQQGNLGRHPGFREQLDDELAFHEKRIG